MVTATACDGAQNDILFGKKHCDMCSLYKLGLLAW